MPSGLKILGVPLLVLLILCILIYGLIPTHPDFIKSKTVKVNFPALSRLMKDESRWKDWWPQKHKNNMEGFVFKGKTFLVSDQMLQTVGISIRSDEGMVESRLHYLPIGGDSVTLSWEAEKYMSYNPLKRIHEYLRFKSLSRDIERLLDTLVDFTTATENLYGYRIREEKVLDSILISTSAITSEYPTTDLVYSLLDTLYGYAARHKANETGYPMLNISTSDTGTFHTRVAIPVNRKLKDSGNIAYKWMLGGGNILVLEVIGGQHAVKRAQDALEFYVQDYRRITPAIPFQSLITNRRKEPDSSRWITRLFYPVM